MIPLFDDNPTRNRPWVTWLIIGLCALVFLGQARLDAEAGQRAVLALGVIPSVLWGTAELAPELYTIPAALTLFSSMFLHGSLLHLGSNLLFLWVFGNNVEDRLGPGRFLVFYLLCGIAAALAHAAIEADSGIPMIGASGAISGCLGAYLLLFPGAAVTVLLPIGPLLWTTRVAARWVVGVWFLGQIVNSLAAGEGPGVAWFAHLGGFAAGLLLLPAFLLGRPPPARRA
jgi:membrane associated rhomboid family serine protease